MQSDSILRHAPGVLSRRNLNGTVSILHLKNEEYFFSVDGIAAELWLMLDGRRTMTEIKEFLKNKHQPPEQDFQSAVESFVQTLVQDQLVSIVR